MNNKSEPQGKVGEEQVRERIPINEAIGYLEDLKVVEERKFNTYIPTAIQMGIEALKRGEQDKSDIKGQGIKPLLALFKGHLFGCPPGLDKNCIDTDCGHCWIKTILSKLRSLGWSPHDEKEQREQQWLAEFRRQAKKRRALREYFTERMERAVEEARREEYERVIKALGEYAEEHKYEELCWVMESETLWEALKPSDTPEGGE